MDSSLDKKLTGFRQIAQEKLQSILCGIPGEKDFVIEPSLIRPLEHVCGASWLRKKGIDKIFKFDAKNPPARRKTLIYLINSELSTFKSVLEQIGGLVGGAGDGLEVAGMKQFHIILFPILRHCFLELLEEEGLFGLVELHKFQWDFLVLDTGVLSLEIPQVFGEVFARQDTTLLASLAHSLRLFHLTSRRQNLVLLYGEQAERVYQMTTRIETFQQSGFRDESADNPDFNAMLIVDRDKDYASCLLHSVVYAALQLELFTHKSGTITIDVENNRVAEGRIKFLQAPKEIAGVECEKKETSLLRMNGAADNTFRENRYRHFSDVIALLSTQAKSLGMEGKNYKEMRLDEMKAFVANTLPKVAAAKKELYKHLVVCETIVQELGATFERQQVIEESVLANENRKQVVAHVDELLSTEAHRISSIRLLALLHAAAGVTHEEATKFITNYCNAFGYHALPAFARLAAARLFPDTSAVGRSNILSNIALPMQRSQFQLDAAKLKLFPPPEGKDTTPQSPSRVPLKKDPTCPSYVFNGNYIPLIAQLSNVLLKAESFDELNAKLGHLEQLKVTGKAADEGDGARSLRDLAAAVKRGEATQVGRLFPLKPRTLFVYVVGGITYAEVAACSLVERFTGSKIVLASNAIVSGGDLIEAALR